jgi:hypothetical protein
MATTAKANTNNFIRWNRITGALTLAGLQALAGTAITGIENERPPENDCLPLAPTEGSNKPSDA